VLTATDHAQLHTLDGLRDSEDLRRITTGADLVLTFLQREGEVRALVPEARVLGLPFIPSEPTRRALAGLDPRMRVAAVSYFKEYIAIMRPSVREFAPHVGEIKATWTAAPDLMQTIAASDAVIFASGADHIAELAPPGMTCFEYRHAPDPGALERVLVPHLAELRRGKIAENDTVRPASVRTEAAPRREATGGGRRKTLTGSQGDQGDKS
jgi:hypothetical protein